MDVSVNLSVLYGNPKEIPCKTMHLFKTYFMKILKSKIGCLLHVSKCIDSGGSSMSLFTAFAKIHI